MERRTPNKRKSLAKNETPSKVQKVVKSPKSANKGNGKTPTKKQPNGSKFTPKLQKKTEVQITDDDESEDEVVFQAKIENDSDVDVREEIDSEEDNTDAEGEDSDAEVDEEEENNDDDDDNEEAQSDDEENEDDEDGDDENDDDETNANTSAGSHFSVIVVNAPETSKLAELFSNSKIVKTVPCKYKAATKNIFVNFADNNSLQNALAKNGTEYEGKVLLIKKLALKSHTSVFVEPERTFSVLIRGLQKPEQIEKLFSDCKMESIEEMTNEFSEVVGFIVRLADNPSMYAALAKNESEFEGRIILVKRFSNADDYYNISLKGLAKESTVEELFPDCNIEKSLPTFKDNSYLIKFADDASVKKALLKHKTVFMDRLLFVYRLHCSVVVKGLSTQEDIKEFLKKCNITNVDNVHKKEEQLPYATVYFADRESKQIALALNSTEHNGTTVTVTAVNSYVQKHPALPSFNHKSGPIVNRPVSNRPFITRPFTNRPFNNRPFNNRPFTNRPFNNRPFTNRPFNNQNRPYEPFNRRNNPNEPFNRRNNPPYTPFNNRPFNKPYERPNANKSKDVADLSEAKLLLHTLQSKVAKMEQQLVKPATNKKAT